MNHTIDSRIRELRKKRNLKQSDLANALCISTSAIGLYEQGRREPDIETIIKIANFFNVSTEYLLGLDNKSELTDAEGVLLSVTDYFNQESPSPKNKGVKIPVYGKVAAGIPINAITDIEDYEEITEEMAATGEHVALEIRGDSMEPRMMAGDVVIVRIQDTIETGEIAIVMVNGDEATCKKIKKTPEGIMLISNNPAYEPMFYSNQEIEQLPIRIFGKVVELRAKFK